MVKIVRVKNVLSPKTPRGVTANPKSGSFHDPEQLVGIKRARAAIKRVFVKDPNNPIWYPERDQFSNNANPKFDPSKAPGAVTILDSTPQPPQGATSGHQKVIKQTDQMKTGGKTLKRR